MASLENAEMVDVLLVVPEKGTRNNIHNILRDTGFENIKTGQTLRQFESHLTIPVPDMIICSAEFPGGDSCDLVRNIRLSDAGQNPFTPIITVTAKPSQEFVSRIISSGTDALVIMPFSTQQLLDRIQALVENRKQFVATSDYLGPDRRPGSRGTSDMKITKFNVPNSLRTKITGEEETIRLGTAIRTVVQEMTLYRLDRQSDQIIYLVGQITQSHSKAGIDQTVETSLMTLQAVAHDVVTRMAGTSYEHVSGLCESLLRVTGEIVNSSNGIQDKNIRLLSQLSLAIQLGFTTTQSASTAHEISDTIGHGT